MKEINYLILKEQKVKCGMIGTDFLTPPSLEGRGQGKGECVICPVCSVQTVSTRD